MTRKKQTYLVDGVVYPSKRAAAAAAGYADVEKVERMAKAKNLTFEQLLAVLPRLTPVTLVKNPNGVHKTRIPVEVNGKHWPSLAAACAAHGVDYRRARMLMHSKQCTPAQAVIEAAAIHKNERVRRAKSKSVEYNGKVYKSWRVACADAGVNYERVRSRVMVSGHTWSDAINMVLRANQGIEIAGKRYKSYRAACAELGLTYTTVLNTAYHHQRSVAEEIERRLALRPKVDDKQACIDTMRAEINMLQTKLNELENLLKR